jgi:hypothetical protein
MVLQVSAKQQHCWSFNFRRVPGTLWLFTTIPSVLTHKPSRFGQLWRRADDGARRRRTNGVRRSGLGATGWSARVRKRRGSFYGRRTVRGGTETLARSKRGRVRGGAATVGRAWRAVGGRHRWDRRGACAWSARGGLGLQDPRGTHSLGRRGLGRMVWLGPGRREG